MKKLTTITLLAILFTSCKKEDNQQQKEKPIPFETNVVVKDKDGKVLETSQTFYFKQ